VTLTSAALSTDDYNSKCKNGTGVKVTAENISGNPNGTTSETPSASGSASASGSGAAASAKSTGLAAQATAASWIMGAVGVAGLALL